MTTKKLQPVHPGEVLREEFNFSSLLAGFQSNKKLPGQGGRGPILLVPISIGIGRSKNERQKQWELKKE